MPQIPVVKVQHMLTYTQGKGAESGAYLAYQNTHGIHATRTSCEVKVYVRVRMRVHVCVHVHVHVCMMCMCTGCGASDVVQWHAYANVLHHSVSACPCHGTMCQKGWRLLG